MSFQSMFIEKHFGTCITLKFFWTMNYFMFLQILLSFEWVSTYWTSIRTIIFMYGKVCLKIIFVSTIFSTILANKIWKDVFIILLAFAYLLFHLGYHFFLYLWIYTFHCWELYFGFQFFYFLHNSLF